jgi:hypothetical protein
VSLSLTHSLHLADHPALAQYCTTWGFLQTSPRVSTPAKDARTYHVSMPKLLSALVDREYMSRVCRQGFPAGEHYKMCVLIRRRS